MNKMSVTTLAFGALCLGAVAAVPASAQNSMNYQMTTTEAVAPGPVASGRFGDWSAARNVRASMHYDRLLEVSPGFRNYRMRKECRPINDPQLRQDCLASFDQYEPMAGRGYGSSLPPYINPPYNAGQ
jgi:hypothetical protein